MGGNYEKGMYHQLMDVMARMDAMENGHKKDQKKINSLTAEVKSLQKGNTQLKAELMQVKEENAVPRKGNLVRTHADGNGKYHIPDGCRADVPYGNMIKTTATFLYGESAVPNDRICTFINSLSGDALNISTGSIYGFCKEFPDGCAAD